MARIRTIKPEFWTDDAVAQLSPTAMLLFIGMWNFADDEGYLRDSVGQLRRQIFPDRGWDVEAALAELLVLGRVLRMDSDQGTLLYLPHMTEHQKISHPTPSKFTSVRPFGTQIPESSGELRSPREPSALKGREGKEGNGREGEGETASPTAEPPLRCPRHLNATNPPNCGRCKDARLAWEQWAKTHTAATNAAPAPKPTKHIPGLCDAHRQPEDTCEMCARDAKDAEAEAEHARAVIYGRFGGTA